MATVATISTVRLGPHVSKGTERLFEWLRSEGVSRAELARRVVCGATTIDRLVHGDRPIQFHIAIALRTECGIALEDWSKPASARFVKLFRAAAKAA